MYCYLWKLLVDCDYYDYLGENDDSMVESDSNDGSVLAVDGGVVVLVVGIDSS